MEHKYGYNLENDKKELYGKNYNEINNEREKILSDLSWLASDMRSSINILQNPVPIESGWIDEWVEIHEKKIEVLKENLKKAEDFARKYHVK